LLDIEGDWRFHFWSKIMRTHSVLQNHKPSILAVCFAFCLSITNAHAQSEVSIAASVGAPSEFVAEGLGAAIGAGAGLSVGTVMVTASAAYLSIDTAANSAAEAASFTIEIPAEIANQLKLRAGAPIDAKQDAHGTRLSIDGKDISYFPKPENGTTHARKAL
jgi:hypothetical protein